MLGTYRVNTPFAVALREQTSGDSFTFDSLGMAVKGIEVEDGNVQQLWLSSATRLRQLDCSNEMTQLSVARNKLHVPPRGVSDARHLCCSVDVSTFKLNKN